MLGILSYSKTNQAFLAGALLFWVLALPLGAALATSHDIKCRHPQVRKEWRRLSVKERKTYIDAQKCMMRKPPIWTSTGDYPSVTSHWEDFMATHIVQADDSHFVGVFYPYHRWLMYHYEKAIQDCGYKGAVPYWDWTLDTVSREDFMRSPIFDPETGFGGNGDWVPGNFTNPEPGLFIGPPWDVPDRTGGGCIQDGPYAGLATHLGPGNNTEALGTRCIRRDFSFGSLATMSGVANVTEAMETPDYGWFSRTTEPAIHSGGHWAVGGLYGAMTDKWASPGDPIFYLHHANVDRSWWSWQTRDIEACEKDISGPLIAFDYDNEVGGNITLDSTVWVGLTTKFEIPVHELMHIQKGPLCYTYDELY